MEEANRHFDNYILMRDMYHDILEKGAKKKKNKRLKTDSEFLAHKQSLKQCLLVHKREIKKLRDVDKMIDDYSQCNKWPPSFDTMGMKNIHILQFVFDI